jgi:hypothetical protein
MKVFRNDMGRADKNGPDGKGEARSEGYDER